MDAAKVNLASAVSLCLLLMCCVPPLIRADSGNSGTTTQRLGTNGPSSGSSIPPTVFSEATTNFGNRIIDELVDENATEEPSHTMEDRNEENFEMTTEPVVPTTTLAPVDIEVTLSDATATSYLVNLERNDPQQLNISSINVSCICERAQNAACDEPETTGDRKFSNNTYAVYSCNNMLPGSVTTANVTAVDENGVSTTHTPTTSLCLPPNEVEAVDRDSYTTTSVHLTWNAPMGGYTKFRVLWNTGEEDETADLHYNVTSLNVHTSSQFSVITVLEGDANCSRLESDSTNATYYTDFPPIDEVTVGEVTTTSMLVTWTHAISNMNSYTVFCTCKSITPVDRECSNGTKNVNIPDDGEFSATCDSLTPGSQYEVKVDATGHEDTKTTEANEFSITKPNVAENLDIGSLNQSFIELMWEEPASGGYNSFHLYQVGEETAIYSGQSTSYIVQGLASSTMYEFYVETSVSYDHQSAQSTNTSTLEAYTLPGPVGNLSTASVEAWNFTLEWSPPSPNQGIEMYLVNVYEDINCMSVVVKLTGSNWTDDMLDAINCADVSEYQLFSTNDNPIQAFISNDPWNDQSGLIQPYSSFDVFVYAINYGGVGLNETTTVDTEEYAPGSVVQDLKVESTTENSVELSWDDPLLPYGEITSYRVYLSFTNCTSNETQEMHMDVATKSATVSDLQEYWDHTFRVEAYNSKGPGESLSDPENAQTNATNPEPVSGLNTSLVPAGSITVTWAPYSPCDINGVFDAFYLDYSYVDPLDGDTDSFSVKADGDINLVTFEIRDALPYKNYTIVLRVGNSNGFNSTGSQVKVQTLEDVPEKPDSLIISDFTSDTITTKWEAPSEPNGVLTNYIVSWCQADAGSICSNSPESTETNATVTQYTIRGLDAFRMYLIWVNASTSVGYGPATDTSVLLDEAKPLPPSSVNVTAVSATTLHVTWLKPENITGQTSYNVTAYADNTACDPPFRTVTVEGFHNTQANITGLAEYWDYTVRVFAVVVNNDSIEFATEADYGGPDEPPPEVKTLEAVPGEVVGLDTVKEEEICFEIQVKWKPPHICEENGDINSYEIKWTAAEEQEQSHSCLTDASVGDACEQDGDFYVYSATALNANDVTYTFTVRPMAQEPGEELDISMSTGLCPPFTPPSPGIGTVSSKPEDPQTQFKVAIDEGFLTDNSNGNLTYSAVIVVHHEEADNGECCETEEDFKTFYKTWDYSRQRAFKYPYRIDYENLIMTSGKKRSTMTTTTIGEDDDCGADSYCNGPLGDGVKYRVALATCTVAGCAVRDYASADFTTEKRRNPDPGSGDKDQTALIVSMSVLIVVLLAVVVVGAVIMQRRGYFEGIFGAGKSDEAEESPRINPLPEPDEPETNRPITIPNFTTRVAELHKDTNMLFAHEYEEVRDTSPMYDKDDSEMAVNRPKNRYTNILPFDQTRVKLLPIEDVDGSDYINANYMPGYNSQREFIAAQGPLPATIDDFWRMIWEQNISVVVMLTNLKERDREKCAKYWPDEGDPKFFDEINVKLRSESVIGDYIVRVLDISRGDQARTIKQLHYIKWPDFGCPDNTNGLLNLVDVVRNEITPANKGPVCVHCSAGVGRTGTFICVDRLLQHMKDHSELDVFGTVLEMRGFRMTMVQSEDQYIYIHDCLRDAIQRGMHLGQNQNVYSNFAMEIGEEDEPLYQNWENGPDPSEPPADYATQAV